MPEDAQDVREIVRERYAAAARGAILCPGSAYSDAPGDADAGGSDGAVLADCTSATMSAEGVSVAMSHATMVVCVV